MPNNNNENLGIFDVDFEDIDAQTLNNKKLKSKDIRYPNPKVPPQGNIMLNKVLTTSDTLKEHRKKV